jgi:hypothetical protein
MIGDSFDADVQGATIWIRCYFLMDKVQVTRNKKSQSFIRIKKKYL